MSKYAVLKTEIWRDVPFAVGYYQISNMGNLRSIDRVITRVDGHLKTLKGVNIKYRSDTYGYFVYSFTINGIVIYKRVHRIVASVFIPNPENMPFINHKNGIKSDNRADNLEWATNQMNIRHAFHNRLNKGPIKPIVQLDYDFELIKEWESAIYASKVLGIAIDEIRRCFRKKRTKITYNGSIWMLKSEFIALNDKNSLRRYIK